MMQISKLDVGYLWVKRIVAIFGVIVTFLGIRGVRLQGVGIFHLKECWNPKPRAGHGLSDTGTTN